MKVAIVGFGHEGQSALKYWGAQNAEILICDQNPEVEIPFEIDRQVGEDYLHDLDRFDIIVRSAGINRETILEKNPDVGDKMTTVVNEFMRVSPTKKIVGVTGSKGKGTTSTLIAKMLEADGQKVFLGGNIGLSPLEFLPKVTPDTWVVLELSSFQLSDLQHSPAIALCLMVVPEHLNWHKDLDDYLLSKAHLFERQERNDTAIYYAHSDLSRRVASYSPGLKIPYFAHPGALVESGAIAIGNQEICRVSDLKLLGEHNWQNVCAALTVVWQITQNTHAFRQVLTTFTGLEHHLELVREVGGVKYYDDSSGTAPEAARVAIAAIREPKVVILGGSDKGIAFDDLADSVVQGNVRHAVLIGQTSPMLEAALRERGFNNLTPVEGSMEAIVDVASQMAQPGDVVLLSPACASFDMFKNAKDRAEQFVAAVNAL
jgi:UDP-N-acetylmuramoylalanine--D-glutamate ligase